MTSEVSFWLFVTAVIFTVFGFIVGRRQKNIKNTTAIVESTVDRLISDGYLKTRGTGKNTEILKWHE